MARTRLRRSVALVALAAALGVGLTSAAQGTGGATASLKLDGKPFSPELALTSAQRSRGLMHRRRAPADGMLFVFSRATSGSFWMKNTLVPLTIVFFDRNGKRVRRMSMTPCRDGWCPLYSPGSQYRFALELRASDGRPALRLGPLGELRHLSGLAS